MPRCSNCNTMNNSNRNTCVNCNAKINNNEGYKCPNCSREVGPFAKKCRNCGLLISNQLKNVPQIKGTRETVENQVNVKVQNAQPNITYLGEVDPFTNETLIDNYQVISNELNVYPNIIVHPRGTVLSKYFAGFFHNDGTIEIVDDYLLISCLAHEMRHMYQMHYMPEMYYSTYITNAKEYINSDIERDARYYSMEYCKSRGYLEELSYLEEEEKKFNLFLKGVYSVYSVGLDDDYFKENPIYPQDFHRETINSNIKTYTNTNTNTYKPTSNHEYRSLEIGSRLLGIFILILCGVGLYLMFGK